MPSKKKATPAPPVTPPADVDLKMEMLPVERLIPYARNARTHSDAQVAEIAASVREFGWTNPVLVDEADGIIAGHGRVLAARKLGMKEVRCIRLAHLSESQRKAYILADNKIALNAGWNEEMLALELSDLMAQDFDLALTGFNADEIDALLKQGTEGLTDPDDAPPVQKEVVSQLGDVWVLGNHRLVCGDSEDASTVALALNGVKPHLMVTDPPYGVNYDPAWRQKAGVGSKGAATGKVMNDNRADWRKAWALFPGSVAYVWHGGLHAHTVAESLVAVKFALRAQIVWVKTRPALSRGHYHWQHEPALYAVKEDAKDDQWRFVPEHEVASYAVKDGSTAEWKGGRKQSTTWFIEHLKSDTGHGTQKPVECMKRPMTNNSSLGQAVYEPFSGSGTSLIAAEMCGRSCHAIELDPAYVDVGVRRWQSFTGKTAVHGVTGKPFPA